MVFLANEREFRKWRKDEIRPEEIPAPDSFPCLALRIYDDMIHYLYRSDLEKWLARFDEAKDGK